MRLYLDEDISSRIAELLRASGVDVVSASEVGARGLSDEDQLRKAHDDARAIISCNHRDFVRLAREWRVTGMSHSGIVVSYHQFSPASFAVAVRRISALAASVSSAALVDAFLVLDDFGNA